MKKCLILLCLLTMGLVGCKINNGRYLYYYGIDEMCKEAEHVFIAKVIDVEAESEDNSVQANRKQIIFNAIVSENLKGDYGVGQEVEDRVNLLYKDFVKPGNTYLFLTGIPNLIENGKLDYYPDANLYEAVEITESGDLNIYRLKEIKELTGRTTAHLKPEPKSLDEIRDLFRSDSVEKITSTFPENISSTENVTSEQLTENYNNFKQTVDSIQADKINKIIMVEYVQGRGTAYALENEKIIKRWISIIKKLEFSSKPFVSTVGLGYEIDVYEENKKIFLGTWLDKWVYNITNLDTIIYIENYDELRLEMEQLKEDTKAYGKIVDLP